MKWTEERKLTVVYGEDNVNTFLEFLLRTADVVCGHRIPVQLWCKTFPR
jgi:hypothetical protein